MACSDCHWWEPMGKDEGVRFGECVITDKYTPGTPKPKFWASADFGSVTTQEDFHCIQFEEIHDDV